MAQPDASGPTGDEQIRTGDVVQDLAKGKTMQVVQKEADSVREYDNANEGKSLLDFFGNQRIGAQPDDTVWGCTFCSDMTVKSSKVYAYPASRLLRKQTERSADSGRRVQEQIEYEMAVNLLATASESADHTDAVVQCLSKFDEQIARDAAAAITAVTGPLAGWEEEPEADPDPETDAEEADN